MNKILWNIWAKLTKRLLPLFLAIIVSLPSFTFQILPSFANSNKGVTVEILAKGDLSSNTPNTLSIEKGKISIILGNGRPVPIGQQSGKPPKKNQGNSLTLDTYVTIKYSLNTDKLYFYSHGEKTGEINLKGKTFSISDFVYDLEKKRKEEKVSYFKTYNSPLSERRIKNSYERTYETIKNAQSNVSSSAKNQILSCQSSARTRSQSLPSGRQRSGSVWSTSNNKAYIFGGEGSGGNLNEIVEFDPVANTITTKSATLPTARCDCYAAWSSVNNKAYIFSGQDSMGYVTQIVEYDPGTDMASAKTATLTGREVFAVAYADVTNKIYVLGGANGSGSLYDILEYDPVGDTIMTKSSTLPSWLAGSHTAVYDPDDRKIYAFGSASSQILQYDPVTDTLVTKTETLPTGGCCGTPGAVWSASNHKIYIYGGWSSGANGSKVTEYDPATGISSNKSEALPVPALFLTAVWSTITNKAYVFGGASTVPAWLTRLNSIIEHTPCTGPDTPSITSVTLDGTPLSTSATSFRVGDGQVLRFNFTSMDAYAGHQIGFTNSVTTVGNFTSSNGYSAFADWTIIPNASNVSTMSISPSISAVSDTGGKSDLRLSISFYCRSDAGCAGSSCINSTCCTPCSYDPNLCSTDMLCSASRVPPPPPSTPSTNPVQTPISTPTPTSTATSTPVTTAAPAANTTPQQGATVSPPAVNSLPLPAAVNTPRPDIGVIDASVGGIVKPQSTPPPSIDFSLLIPKNNSSNAKPDSANVPYIDFSEGGLVGPKK